jgi:hypothetical protein
MFDLAIVPLTATVPALPLDTLVTTDFDMFTALIVIDPADALTPD